MPNSHIWPVATIVNTDTQNPVHHLSTIVLISAGIWDDFPISSYIAWVHIKM